MPSLGFLKKIRHKDGNHGHGHSRSQDQTQAQGKPAAASQQPPAATNTNTPATAANARGSIATDAIPQQQQQQQAVTGSTPASPPKDQSVPTDTTPAAQQLFQQPGAGSGATSSEAPRAQQEPTNSVSGSTAGAAPSGSAPAPVPAPPAASVAATQDLQQPHQPPAAQSPSPSQAPPESPAKDPNINQLLASSISQPKHDGAANADSATSPSSAPFQTSTASIDTSLPAAASTSASPGTDPTKLQRQQQAVFPPPPSDQSAPTMQSSNHPQQSLQVAHGQPTTSSTLSVPQETLGGQQQQQSQPRVTKGKYSLTDFDILRTLGTGSFGRVHLVQSKHNQRFYAIKVLKKAQVVKMKQVEHTNDERRMLSDVKHPFLVTLWGTFQDVKNIYMVMDFVEGGELFSLLRKSGRFPNPVAKFYAAEVTLALEYMHSKNIIYRDLKPENLLLDRHGHLKITDFGFAKRVPDKTWTLCGTPDYLAPEVVSNKGYNKSVDWWSLGILIYEMLCGYTPFWDSGSPMKIYENILKGKIKYPAYINPDAQNLLERLITADLTKRLGNLYAGSQDVKNHPWFSEVTWDRLARKDIDAPYTPPVKGGSGDASQFDKYPEDPDRYDNGAVGNDEYGHLFTEF